MVIYGINVANFVRMSVVDGGGGTGDVLLQDAEGYPNIVNTIGLNQEFTYAFLARGGTPLESGIGKLLTGGVFRRLTIHDKVGDNGEYIGTAPVSPRNIPEGAFLIAPLTTTLLQELLIKASSAGAVWGNVTGNLSAQTDLMLELAQKTEADVSNTWTAPQRSAQQTLNDLSGTLTLDFNTTAAGVYVQDVPTLTVALANVPTDRAANMVLRIQHAGSANHAWAWSSAIRWVGSTPTVPTAAGSGLFIFQVFPGGFVTGAYREVAA